MVTNYIYSVLGDIVRVTFATFASGKDGKSRTRAGANAVFNWCSGQRESQYLQNSTWAIIFS